LISICHSPKLKVAIEEYISLNGIEQVWNSILPSQHSLLSENLMVLENAQLSNMEFKYLVLKRKDQIIGVAYLQHLKLGDHHFNGTALDKPGLGWLKKSIHAHFTDVLICGNLFRVNFSGFHFKHLADEVLIFDLLIDYLKSNKAYKKFCGVLIKDCEHKFNETSHFKLYKDDVTMEIDIKLHWLNMEAYKNDLSKKYRQRFSKIIKSKEQLVVKELTFNEILNNAHKIEKLYLNVAMKQSLRIGFVNANYFIELKKRYKDNFKIMAYYFENKLVAFSSYILYPDKSMEIHFIGIDYDYNEKKCLYFNILYDGLEFSIQNQMTRLELGRTARVPKASIGAIPVEANNYIFLRKGIPSLAFGFFNTWFVKNLGDDWKNRSPFKVNG
jgi:hypothetical protein